MSIVRIQIKKIVGFGLISALLMLALFAGGCGSKQSNQNPKDDQQSKPAAGAETGQPQGDTGSTNSGSTLHPKAKELEKALLQQLGQMPKMNTGDNIGVLVISLTNPFWVGMKENYIKAGTDLGVNVEVMAGPTEGDTKSQLETLEAMVAKDYKALILSPIEPYNLVPGVVKANKKGIKVINLGPGIDVNAVQQAGGHLDGRITVSYEEQGALVAKRIVEKLGQEGGKVAIIQGIPGAGQSEGRTKGAREVFESSKGINLVSIQPGNWDRNTAYNITTNLIQAHPDLKAIFACNDVMALAAADALEAAGKREGRLVFGVDFIPQAQEAIKSGKLDGTVGYSPRVYTRAAVILAMKAIEGHDLPKAVYAPLILVTKENVSEFGNWE